MKLEGIMIDSKLSFNTQVNLVCKKANNALSFLYSCQQEVKAKAYQIYVSPISEYTTFAWAPIHNVILMPFKDGLQDL